ncbi:Ribonuclease UK114 [Aix galericulata]|nr:Ribonuclease UK114 [Aix galericulata]
MASLVKKIISTAKAPAAMGPYSQAVLVDRTMYIAGQIGIEPSSGQLVSGGAKEEAKQALKNMGEILKAAGCDYGNDGSSELSSDPTGSGSVPSGSSLSRTELIFSSSAGLTASSLSPGRRLPGLVSSEARLTTSAGPSWVCTCGKR